MLPTVLRAVACALYFALPAAVEVGIGRRFGVPSYPYFAAPHIAWLAASTGLRFSTAAFHAGLVGASIALLALYAQFQCCVDNSNGLGWLLYWPVAALLMTFGAGIELTARLLRERSRP